MSEENVEVVRRIYEAFNEGDFARAVAPAAPDFEFVPDEREIIGVFQGREKVQRYLEDQADVFDENQVQPEEFFAKDDQVIVFLRVRGRGRTSGVELDVRIAHVWTFRAESPSDVRCMPNATRPSKPPGCGSRRCRRRTWRLFAPPLPPTTGETFRRC